MKLLQGLVISEKGKVTRSIYNLKRDIEYLERLRRIPDLGPELTEELEAELAECRKVEKIICEAAKSPKFIRNLVEKEMQSILSKADTQVKTIETSKQSRTLKQRILMEVLKRTFETFPFPKCKKTLDDAWLHIGYLESKIFNDPLTGQECKVKIKGERLFIMRKGFKKHLSYKKCSIRPYIKLFK